MEILVGIVIAVGAVVWYGRHITFQSCRAFAFLVSYRDGYDITQANSAAASLTWRMCLMMNNDMTALATTYGGQPAMRKAAKQAGWMG
ncbi:hypothetical protein ACTV1X_004167 [Cronobacter sakazakii]